MAIEDGWRVQAVTPFDVSAMSSAERIMGSSEESQASRTMSDAYLEHATKAQAAVTDLNTGMIFNSDRPDGRPGVTASPADENMGLTGTAASVGTGGAIDHTREFFVLNQLDQAYTSSLSTAAQADLNYSGRIVDYTA